MEKVDVPITVWPRWGMVLVPCDVRIIQMERPALPQHLELLQREELDPHAWVVGSATGGKWWNPFRKRRLHHEFMRAPLEVGSAQALAAAYGMPYDGPIPASEGDLVGLPVATYLFEMWRLRLVHDYYVMLRQGDLGFLHSRERQLAAAIHLGFSFTAFVQSNSDDETLSLMRNEFPDLERRARAYILRAIGEATSSHARILLAEDTFALHLYGEGLLGALYLLLLREIQHGRGFRTCPECGHPFIASRSTQAFCSKACGGLSRTRTYDQKHACSGRP